MAEDMGDRTEAPTQRKIDEAHEKGQVAKSTDLVAAIDLIAAALLLWYFGSVAIKTGTELMAGCLKLERSQELFDARNAGSALVNALITMAPIAIVAILVLLVTSVVSHLQQTRLIWTRSEPS